MAGVAGNYMLFYHTSIGSWGRIGALTVLAVFMGAPVGYSQEAAPGVKSKGWTPIQLKCGQDVALFSNHRNVYGIRLGFVEDFPEVGTDSYGTRDDWAPPGTYRASNIVGLDISLVSAHPVVMRGIQVSGLLARSGDMRGIAVGGVVARAGEDARGIVVGGLFAGAGRELRGIAIGGLFAGAGRGLRGIAIGGGGTRVEDMVGIQLAIGPNIAETGKGAQISFFWSVCEELNGVQIGVFNTGGAVHDNEIVATGKVRGVQIGIINGCAELKGVQIGIINSCAELKGVQIGLLNIAEGRARWPVINVRF